MTENTNGSKNQQSMTEFVNESNEIRPVSPEEVYAYKFLIISFAKERFNIDYHSAEDLVQEVAIKCWRNPTVRYNPAKGSLASFLIKIAINMIYDQWRKKRKLQIDFRDIDSLLKDSDDSDDYCKPRSKSSDDSDDYCKPRFKPLIVSDDSYENKYQQQVRILDSAIAKLYRQYPSKQAIDAFVMFARYGKPAKEVARLLGVDEGFVNTAVFRIKKRLKNIIRCLTEDEDWPTSAD